MEIVFASMHHIDLPEEKIVPTILNNDDVQTYIKELTKEALENKHRKYFKIKSETSEVVATVRRIFNNKSLEESDKDVIATRLLNSEIERQEQVKQLDIEIKKGSLIQSLFKNDEGIYYFLIAKIESNRFLDTSDLITKEGLLFENKAFKTCVFKIDSQNSIEEILLSDNNKKIAEYWYNTFLELKELTDDETNTKNSFAIINHQLKKDLEKDYPQDYILMQNIAKSYFQTKNVFRQEEFLNTLFDDYTPQSADMKLDEVRGKLVRAYNRKISDTEFNIKVDVIRPVNMKIVKPVNSFIEVTLMGTESQIKNNIISVDENGTKYLKIKITNEETYKSFHWNTN